MIYENRASYSKTMTQMTKKRWIESYGRQKAPPHWALSLKPSKLVKIFLRIIEKGKILEIGCGNGRDSLFLAQNGLNVVGIDLSRKAVELAQKNFEESKISGKILFKVADAEKLPFPARTFDGVYSIGVLHSTNLDKSFAEIARVIKPGGLAFLHLWQKTYFLKTKKTEVLCSPAKLKSVIKQLPFKIVMFKNSVTTGKTDYEEDGKNPHCHFAIIVKLKKDAA